MRGRLISIAATSALVLAALPGTASAATVPEGFEIAPTISVQGIPTGITYTKDGGPLVPDTESDIYAFPEIYNTGNTPVLMSGNFGGFEGGYNGLETFGAEPRKMRLTDVSGFAIDSGSPCAMDSFCPTSDWQGALGILDYDSRVGVELRIDLFDPFSSALAGSYSGSFELVFTPQVP